MMLTPAVIILLIYSAAVLALTAAEYRQDLRAQWLFKPLCALGFILLALQSGALDTAYGQLILGALLLCAIGDVALLARNSSQLFLLGMGAFGLGHALFAFTFLSPYENLLGGSLLGRAIGLFGAALLLLIFTKLIWKHIANDMRLPVGIYIVIIALMLITAMDHAVAAQRWMVGAAAGLFATSDVFVGKERFVAQKPWHAFAITPLYFGAQALFALSTNQAL